MISYNLDQLKEEDKNQNRRNLIIMGHRLARLFDLGFSSGHDDPNDVLYNPDPENADAELLLSILDFSDPDDPQLHRHTLERRVKMLYKALASALRGFKHKGFYSSILSISKWSIYYKFHKSKRWDHGNFMLTLLDREALLRLFKLVQSYWMQKSEDKNKSYEKVAINAVLAIPISQEDDLNKENRDSTETPKMIAEDLDMQPIPYKESLDKSEYLQFRINCHEDWGRVNWKKAILLDSDSEPVHFPCVIIFVHGGGFVTNTSASYQRYTRQWAKDTNLPVFSVDYRLGPDFKHPAGVSDNFQFYCWLRKYSKKYLGITFDRCVMLGDSAGGNLIIGTTALAIQKGVQIPDAIMPVYPAVNVTYITFNPTDLLTLDDLCLNTAFLTVCFE